MTKYRTNLELLRRSCMSNIVSSIVPRDIFKTLFSKFNNYNEFIDSNTGGNRLEHEKYDMR